MPWISLSCVLISLITHWIRFGHSSSVWVFLAAAGIIVLMIGLTDKMGDFLNYTDSPGLGRWYEWVVWFLPRGLNRGYIDEPTHPLAFKFFWFILLFVLCVLFAMKPELGPKSW